MKLNHFLIPYLGVLGLMFISILTSGGIAWYESLILPAWHPSLYIIAVIWTGIYLCLIWSLLIVWNKGSRDARFTLTIAGFIALASINVVWCALFFNLHLIELSIVAGLSLALIASILSFLMLSRSKKAALLLLPYVLWVLFGTYLTYIVSLLN